MRYDSQTQTFSAADGDVTGTAQQLSTDTTPARLTFPPHTSIMPKITSPTPSSPPHSSASDSDFVHVRRPKHPAPKQPERTWASIASKPKTSRPSKHRAIGNDNVQIADPEAMNWEAA